ncbi:MAG: acylphosphatase [Sphingobium sp.]
MTVVARHLAILGQVQGVWYRKWTIDTARRLGLFGWVRNRLDGSVEAVVEGDAAAVDAFVTHCHAGPPAARVARIDTSAVPVADFTSFDHRPTA